MRFYISLLFSAMAIFAVGCDVFLADGIGGDGEPCVGDGNCEPGLVCNFGDCGPSKGLGEECDEQYAEKQLVCESGLGCIDDVCVEVGGQGQPCNNPGMGKWCDEGLRCIDDICEAPTDVDEVKQPNANLYWLLCPVENDWDGWECSTSHSMRTYDGEDAQSACPSGYRLPTRNEMIALLGGCESDMLEGYGGYCNSCEESNNCSAMFEQFNDEEFWTSTKDDDDEYWKADFGDGSIYCSGSIYSKGVRCVRSGD